MKQFCEKFLQTYVNYWFKADSDQREKVYRVLAKGHLLTLLLVNIALPVSVFWDLTIAKRLSLGTPLLLIIQQASGFLALKPLQKNEVETAKFVDEKTFKKAIKSLRVHATITAIDLGVALFALIAVVENFGAKVQTSGLATLITFAVALGLGAIYAGITYFIQRSEISLPANSKSK